MNDYSNCSNGAGLLKKVYPQGGPVAQMNDKMPMMAALRKKRDLLKTK